MHSSHRTLYRSRHGLIFGVCRGIADYANISVLWIRLGAILGLLVTGFWPLFLIYTVAAIFLRPAPVIELNNDEDWSFYQTYVSDRKTALSRLKGRFDKLEKRTRRVEDIVTDRSYDWDRRFQSGS